MKEKSDLERDFFWSDMLVCRRWTLMILVDRKNDSQNVSKLHMKHARKFVANLISSIAKILKRCIALTKNQNLLSLFKLYLFIC